MRDLKNFNFQDKKIIVRCDFNVPLGGGGVILDDFRIRKTIPTIKYLIKENGKVILISHLGRPSEGQKFSLRIVARRLSELLSKEVGFLEDCIGNDVEDKVNQMKAGDVLLLENLRFHKEEEENNEEFARSLTALGEIYINDAFSVCHRSHASIVGIPKYLPSFAGLLLEKEIETLTNVMENPRRPLGLIIGGAKVKDKSKIVGIFSKKADFFLLGNLVADEVKKIGIKSDLGKIIFSEDSVGGRDIGLLTIEIFKEKISRAGTIFWAGPLGKIDEERYQSGTRKIINAVLSSGCFSVVGGGDMIEFINKLGIIDRFNHVSVGGSAMLDFLAGKKLPGIEALQ